MCATTPKPECTENAKLNNCGVIDYTELTRLKNPAQKTYISKTKKRTISVWMYTRGKNSLCQNGYRPSLFPNIELRNYC